MGLHVMKTGSGRNNVLIRSCGVHGLLRMENLRINKKFDWIGGALGGVLAKFPWQPAISGTNGAYTAYRRMQQRKNSASAFSQLRGNYEGSARRGNRWRWEKNKKIGLAIKLERNTEDGQEYFM